MWPPSLPSLLKSETGSGKTLAFLLPAVHRLQVNLAFEPGFCSSRGEGRFGTLSDSPCILTVSGQPHGTLRRNEMYLLVIACVLLHVLTIFFLNPVSAPHQHALQA